MRALVISGGGSKGAFAGGVAEYLLKVCNHRYDLFIGTSTGSLLIPLLSINEVDRLKYAFTNVYQMDVFNNCPLIIKKVNGEFTSQINHAGILKMFLQGKKTLGESKNLRNLIGRVMSASDYEKISTQDTEVILTVSNLSTNMVEYKSSKDCGYNDFCDWMWASANVVPFMSLVEKDGYEYADGGMGNIVPIYEAVKRGATEIDVIVLNTKKKQAPRKKAQNALELISRVFDFMLNHKVIDDITIGEFAGNQGSVKLNFFQPKEMLTTNSLIFDPVKMTEWWERGYDYAKDVGPSCKCIDIGSPAIPEE